MCRGSSKERLAGPSPRGAEAEGPWPGGPGRPGTSICEEQRQGGVLKAPEEGGQESQGARKLTTQTPCVRRHGSGLVVEGGAGPWRISSWYLEEA